MTINKKLKLFTITGALIMTVLFTGCHLPTGHHEYDLPDKPRNFVKTEDESMDSMVITIDGRTYAPFGRVDQRMDQGTVRECLGYIDGDKDDRVYTISQDPHDNYIMIKYVGGVMDQPEFWRDIATRGEDIFTPEFIADLGYEEWADSGIYSELATFDINVTVDADDIKILTMEYTVNGRPGGGLQCGYMDGSSLESGLVHCYEIDEIALEDKVEKGASFETEISFIITAQDGNNYKAEGSYNGEAALGSSIDLKISGDSENGYHLT